MDREIWKNIQGYEELYQVSNGGRVKSLKWNKSKILKPALSGRGYLMIGIYKEGKRKPVNIHKLVAEAFLTRCPNKNQINHKDGNKTNNLSANLEWCTCKENIIHARKTGLTHSVNGEKVGTSKLKTEQVKEIRSLNDKDLSQKLIAKKFNISQQMVHKIITNKCWANI